MDDLIADFITETNDSLTELDQDLVELEKNPNDPDLLSKIFRMMHTVKGTCGFIGLARLESIAHAGENILGKFRDKEISVDEAGITLILKSIDKISEIVLTIEETGAEPEGDDSELKKDIENYIAKHTGGEVAEAEPEPEAEAKEPEHVVDFDVEEMSEDDLEAIFGSPKEDTGSSEEKAEAEPEAEAPKAEDKPEEKVEEKPAQAAEAKPEADSAPASNKKAPPTVTQTIRVGVDVLENLMTIASELVLTRNQLIQNIKSNESAKEIEGPIQRLSHNVSELQDGVMKTRMQPIGNAWTKLPRIIRDLSNELGKDIELVMSGEDTELDRQVLELIRDPLTHMVRNSADHGIEGPDDREAAGKPAKGTINLSAYHEGGHIIIEIKDDGKGLNKDGIMKKALENSVMTQEELDAATEKQIYNLIFAPGFSTAEAVTAVSGRGVGMDVVRSNIQKIGGTVELESTPGKGTQFLIKIPLTLAIVSALIVEVGPERFAIPQINVTELVRTGKDNKVENIKGAEVIRLRDQLLPLINLRDLLGLSEKPEEIVDVEPIIEDVQAIDAEVIAEGDEQVVNVEGAVETVATETAEAEIAADGDVAEEESTEDTTEIQADNVVAMKDYQNNPFIVVIQVGNNSMGVIVDSVHDTEEIVVKPVSPILKSIDVFSGNTILGDGRVVMILDPNGLSKAAGDLSSTSQKSVKSSEGDEVNKSYASGRDALLIFKTAEDDTSKVIPLKLVGRLEEFSIDDIEVADNNNVVQYRGRLMPLIPFDPNHTVEGRRTQPALVFFDDVSGRTMGLMVDSIEDIVEECLNIEQSQGTPGLLGSTIINDQAMDVIDIPYFMNKAFGDWFAVNQTRAYEDGDREYKVRRILMVDDSSFFRNMLAPFLNVSGFEVFSAKEPSEALALRDKGEMFDIIISDIEMPGMSGFEFAEAVRKEGPWQDTPMIALSSHATQSDIKRGEESGFDNFVAKFDRDMLLEALENASTKVEAA